MKHTCNMTNLVWIQVAEKRNIFLLQVYIFVFFFPFSYYSLPISSNLKFYMLEKRYGSKLDCVRDNDSRLFSLVFINP